MSRLPILALGLLAVVPATARALEIKNIRPCYAPTFLGATRSDLKVTPGDVLFFTYDIEGLSFDPKTGKATFVTTMELLDAGKNQLFKKDTPNEAVAQLGGSRMPGDLNVQLPRNQKPGKYYVRLTVADRLSKEVKAVEYPFELAPVGFGFVGVSAPTIGFPGQPYIAGFALVDMALNAKQLPDVDVMMRVLDAATMKPVAAPIFSNLPKDLPEEVDLKKENFVPMQYPLYLNRTGNFIIEVMARDKIANKTIELRYPLTVIDIGAVGK